MAWDVLSDGGGSEKWENPAPVPQSLPLFPEEAQSRGILVVLQGWPMRVSPVQEAYGSMRSLAHTTCHTNSKAPGCLTHPTHPPASVTRQGASSQRPGQLRGSRLRTKGYAMERPPEARMGD